MSEEPLLTSIAGSNSSSMGYSSIPPKSIAEVRPELPTHLVTQRQRWIALWLTAAAMSLSSGPVASWPTLEPLLIDAGVWKGGNTHSNLDVVYGIATAVQMGASLPAGWIYDRYGGRLSSLGGAIASAVGLLLMSLSCYYPASLSWLLFAGYPLAMVGGMINSYGIFAFLWLLPDDQNFVASMVPGAQALSDMLALVAVGLSACCSVFIGEFFLVLSILSVLAGFLCYALVPPLAVVNALAAKALADTVKGSSDDDFALHAALDAQAPLHHEGCKEIESVKSSWALMRRHAGANTILLVFSTVYFMSMMYPTQQMYFYYEELFANQATAKDLVNVFAVLFGVAGFACALAGGKLCDRIGIQKFTVAVSACAMSMGLLFPFKNYWLQVLAQVVMVVGSQLYTIVVNRFAMLYAPPHLFGTFSGVQFSVVSVGMLLGMSLVSLVMQYVATTGALQYQIPCVCLSVLSAGLGLVLVEWWRRHPPPVLGGLSSNTSGVEDH